MITWDYHQNAIAVARDVAMLESDSPIMVIDAVKEVSNAVHIMLPEQSPHLQPSIDMSAVQLPSPSLIQGHE